MNLARMEQLFNGMGHDHGHDHDNHVDEPMGVEQSLEELEFLRSACAAAQAGDVGKLARLLKNKHLNALHGDGTVDGDTGYTPLHYGARAGHLAVVELLLAHSADVNATTKYGKATALHRAAHQGHAPVVAALIAARADVSLADTDGMLALHKAAAEGHADAFGKLLSAAPQLAGVRDKKGRTAKDCATEKGHQHIVATRS
ncbi:ankyrin repeat-containing domain protein [Pavlovales sp. CCMP2436]|nr:ankyrin repeat-containing domain protein [Pavlovales sp. CCMP2436]|mmetsp:Transcript_38665/g.89494  ORF Transcript_38665/g.89494 Transcript_38665/m.89494 type:complete len:201 (-) Transcript_38665:101-703(-)